MGEPVNQPARCYPGDPRPDQRDSLTTKEEPVVTVSERPSEVRRHSFSSFFRLIAMLDDVAGFEQDASQQLAPLLVSAQQELEVHTEVLELLMLRVAHDGSRLPVLLQRKTLLVP